MSKEKRDFGSFHSSNVQELLNLPEDQYVPPPLPFSCEKLKDYKHNKPKFGRWMRDRHFYLENETVFLNHGAFGGVLKEALEVAQQYQMWTERQPLRFYDRELLPRLVHVTRRIAAFVGCDPRDIVLVENATTALNTVIQNIPLAKGDRICCFNITYGAGKKMLRWRCEQTGARLEEITVDFPVKDEQQLLQYVEDHIDGDTKLAVIDHIPSNTPIIMPVKQMVQICRKRQVPVLVDGAHALGSLPLNISDIDADYYITNAHKWLCSPKGAALLYVRKELQAKTRPLIVSHGLGSGFNSEFIWAGLHDYSPFLALHTVLDFWENIGRDVIQEYMHSLCTQAGEMLTKSWGTTLAAPANMFGSMSLIGLPSKLYQSETIVDYSVAERVQNRLYHEFNIEVPVKCVQEKLYVRISAHVYNDIGEYETLRDAVLTMTGAETS